MSSKNFSKTDLAFFDENTSHTHRLPLKVGIESNTSYNKKQMYELAEAATHIINEELYNPELSVKYVARKLYVSVSHLYRCSVARYGISVSEYINNQRLEKARELIMQSKLPLSQISSDLNYCSQSYFCTCFRKKYGITPLQYKHYLQGE